MPSINGSRHLYALNLAQKKDTWNQGGLFSHMPTLGQSPILPFHPCSLSAGPHPTANEALVSMCHKRVKVAPNINSLLVWLSPCQLWNSAALLAFSFLLLQTEQLWYFNNHNLYLRCQKPKVKDQVLSLPVGILVSNTVPSSRDPVYQQLTVSPFFGKFVLSPFFSTDLVYLGGPCDKCRRIPKNWLRSKIICKHVGSVPHPRLLF